MLSYSFFETLIYYFFVVIKFVYVLIYLSQKLPYNKAVYIKENFKFSLFSCWEVCEEEESNLQATVKSRKILFSCYSSAEKLLFHAKRLP